LVILKNLIAMYRCTMDVKATAVGLNGKECLPVAVPSVASRMKYGSSNLSIYTYVPIPSSKSINQLQRIILRANW